MVAISIDHRVGWLLENHRDAVVEGISRSRKMYQIYAGEDVGEMFDSFAVANPQATLGELIGWTKQTYVERLAAKKKGEEFKDWKVKGGYDPTTPLAQPEEREVKRQVEMVEAVRAVPRVRQAVPSQPSEDVVDDPQSPPDPANFPATDANAGQPDPVAPRNPFVSGKK